MSLLHKKILLILSGILILQSAAYLAKYSLELQDGGKFGADFTIFWEAARYALQGKLDAIYTLHTFTVPPKDFTAPFLYPPHALLILAPFGLLTYNQAVLLWSAGWVVLFYGAFWKWFRSLAHTLGQPVDRHLCFMTLAIPLPFIMANLFNGQWGTAVATYFLYACMTMRSCVRQSGIAAGLMTMKPHLAIPLYLVIACRRQWKLLAYAGATILVLVLSSLCWLRASLWFDYVQVTVQYRHFLQYAHGFFDHLALAPYISLQAIGAPQILSLLIQVIISIMVLFTLFRIFRHIDARDDLRVALLACGCLLIVPYSLLYDSPLLTVTLLPLLLRAWRDGWSGMTEIFFFTAALLTPYAQLLLISYHVPFGLIAISGLFWVTYRRYAAASST